VSEKLIRDRVPSLYSVSLPHPDDRQADEAEFVDLLLAKLREETDELITARMLEELADVLEVVRAIAGAIGSSVDELERARVEKSARVGDFSTRLVWMRPDGGRA
jgi:predicted house-cleaning noncanonical NTP pyrophosphatase (MazG superfamily)